jgi:hypothetical protein
LAYAAPSSELRSSRGKRSNPCGKFLWHIGKHLQPGIGIVKDAAAGNRIKFQQLGLAAAFADQPGNAALDFGRDGLAYYRDIKFILFARIDQTGFIQCGNHPVACTFQDKLPGAYYRGIDTRTQNQRHAVLSNDFGSEDRPDITTGFA